MATVLAKNTFQKGEADQSAVSFEGIPTLGAPIEEKRFWFQRNKDFDPFAVATQPSVFDDPDSAEKYQPREDWENYHRFDPLARWTWAEEYALVRKIDVRIMIWACIMFMALELDRANISQANTDNMLGDLKMSTNASCQFWLNGRDSFLACRALLGLLQGGFIPDIILYLSYFYKHHELSLRLGFFWTAMSIADILSAIFAYGLLHMRGVQGHSGWRWLFLIEGLLTLVIGIFGFLLMPAGPVNCELVSREKGVVLRKVSWTSASQRPLLSEKDADKRYREETILVNRVLREDPSKSSMHNREPITPRLLWDSLKDYDLWPLYILGLTFQIPMTPPSQYLTLTLKNLGFDTFQANLLAIPYTVCHMVTMLAITYLGEVIGELTFVSMSGQVWALPFLIYLNVVDTSGVNRWVLYTVITLLLMYPNPHPIQVGWNSRNSNTVRSRTVSAACYNMFVQTDGIISSNIYRSDDAPLYKRGNRSLLGIVCMNLVLYPLVKAYYVYRNKRRDRVWDGMSEEQRLAYLETTKDEGNKRLDFRFSH
ncbi:phthalate transporter [Colletotrichum salicis]|uniref:Phthalate transporter n=1 Tax=Colletotrichum salicis TaxID=1209931 RepID=A0A135UZ23_9PEZI|nr:phthalate transporter [Colletotrichum salicis]